MFFCSSCIEKAITEQKVCAKWQKVPEQNSHLSLLFFGWFWCRHLKPSGEKVEEHNSGESGSSGHCPGPRPLTPPATELENEISESIRVSESQRKFLSPPAPQLEKESKSKSKTLLVSERISQPPPTLRQTPLRGFCVPIPWLFETISSSRKSCSMDAN